MKIKVKAWNSRGKLPLAIDSTASFAEVWLRDGLGGALPSGVSEHELRLMYTMVFIRFVNGMVDPAQKGVFAASVVSVAESLGLPTWFVDLRHAGTHDHLPSISILRSGCNQAMQWLHDNYWVQQQLYMKDTFSEVKNLLGLYQSAFLSDGEKKQAGNTDGASYLVSVSANELYLIDIQKTIDPKLQEGPRILSELTSFILADSYRDFLIPTLLEPGFLIPLDVNSFSTFPELEIDEGRANWWGRAVDWFDQQWQGFLEDFLLAMINSLSETSDEESTTSEISSISSLGHMSTLAAWCKYFIIKIKNHETQLLKSLEEACLRNPNRFTHELLLRIMDKEGHDSKPYEPLLKYMEHLSVVNNTITSSTDSTSMQLTTASDLPTPTADDMAAELKLLYSRIETVQRLRSIEEEDKQEDGEAMEVDGEKGEEGMGRWKVASHMDWRRAPLGCVPGMGLPDLSLPVEVDLDLVAFERMLETVGLITSHNLTHPHQHTDPNGDQTNPNPPLTSDPAEPRTPDYHHDETGPTQPLYIYQAKRFSSLTKEEVGEVIKKVRLL
ncbi:Ribosomal biogenesis protein las1l [Dinochytrium kinnereticum]|nr:Ribosomal biogenesis protein las1l [Dinochytrium kinnereticum]